VQPFIGSEAIASGTLTRGQLRWNHVAVHPDVYLATGSRRDVVTNARAAWLWTGRRGVIAGLAAAALHGAGTVPESTPIEMIGDRTRRRPGVVVRHERLDDDEVAHTWIPLTSPARTALDLARRLRRDTAVVHLDGLARATGLKYAEATALRDRYRGARGVAQAGEALYLMDGGTRCPLETRIRLMLADAGLPRPRTPIVLTAEDDYAVIGMGWDGPRVGVSFYEGSEVSDPYCLVQRTRRQDFVQRMDWMELLVTPMDTRASVIHRARRALRERGG
jgi:hypothetical protein